MSERGKPSTAHEYDPRGQCKHCGTYKNVIDKMSLECTPAREQLVDGKAKKKAS